MCSPCLPIAFGFPVSLSMMVGPFLCHLTHTGPWLGSLCSLGIVGPFLITAGLAAASSESCFCSISITPGFPWAIGSTVSMMWILPHSGQLRAMSGMSLFLLNGRVNTVPHLPHVWSGIVSPPVLVSCLALPGKHSNGFWHCFRPDSFKHNIGG